MKRGSTLFLKGVLVIMAVAVLVLCIFWLPGIAKDKAVADPAIAYLQYPFLVFIYISSVPFFLALYQAYKLLNHIDANLGFSELSVQALKYIKYCAVTIVVLLIAGILYVTFLVKGDQANIVSLGLILAFATSVIATFAAVLQKLVQNGLDIKSENDLTV
jgi:hypothetical protein